VCRERLLSYSNVTAGKDHRTHAISQAILNEEIEHESWFSEFLGEGPSGHFMRHGETSPFVRPFMPQIQSRPGEILIDQSLPFAFLLPGFSAAPSDLGWWRGSGLPP
jgi:hypothetical protein